MRVLPPITLGPVTAGVIRWRRRDRRFATVVAKAAFQWIDGARMTALGAPRLRHADEHDGGSPNRSIRGASDRVPFRTRVDVLLVGHAHATDGVPTPRMQVRLAIDRAGAARLDKRLVVVGDHDAEGAAPRPFARMPIVHERALGGIGYPDNPFGVGIGGGPRPNLVAEVAGATAGFGPLAASVAARKRFAAGLAARDVAADEITIPDALADDFWQSAPRDQQIESLAGDERVVLEGFRFGVLRCESTLPAARALALVWLRGRVAERAIPVDPRLDSVAIDADAGVCELVWRGHLEVADAEEISAVIALSLPERPVSVDALHRALAARPASSSPAPHETRPSTGVGGTLVIEPTRGAPDALSKASTLTLEPARESATANPLPFAASTNPRAASSRAPMPGAPWDEASAAPPPISEDLDGTLATPDQPASAAEPLTAVSAAHDARPPKKAEEVWPVSDPASATITPRRPTPRIELARVDVNRVLFGRIRAAR